MSLNLLVGASFVEEVEIFYEQREEWNDNSLTLISSASWSPHGSFQSASITTKITRRVHLVLEYRKFGRLNFSPLQRKNPRWIFIAMINAIAIFTVFFNREMGDMLRPAMIAIRLLKLPMLNDSRAVSIQNSINLARCFFFGCYK